MSADSSASCARARRLSDSKVAPISANATPADGIEVALPGGVSAAPLRTIYLVHLHRSHLDALGGTLNSLTRTAVLERGTKQEVANTVAILRDQLERRP